MDLLAAEQISQLNSDELDLVLSRLGELSSQIKAMEVRVLREIDRRQIPMGDGMRTLEDWIVGRMDVTSSTAHQLATVARADSSELDDLLTEEGVSFDRVATLANAGITDPHHEFDMAGLRTMLARRRAMARTEEHDTFASRFFAIQPTLDDSAWRLWGQLPALEGKIVASTLDEVADQLPQAPAGHLESRATRRADALFTICDRRLDGEPGAGVNTTVIVDATDPETVRPNAWVVSGPRVGPNTLERLLCESPVEVIAVTADGRPLAVGNSSTSIPSKTRRFVLYRDRGLCTADGCGSMYRLQPHHIQERSVLGDNHPDNLTSLCWYHHHVVVHGRGFKIDPESQPRRRRFLAQSARALGGSDPP